MKTFDNDVREFITAQVENVELDGLCPICGTGRSQNGECWRGHIVINVRRPTPLALDGGDSVAFEQLSTPEVLSTLQGESTPAHRK